MDSPLIPLEGNLSRAREYIYAGETIYASNSLGVQPGKLAELSSQCPECARARAAGTLTSVARARDTRVQSLVELLFGTRLGPA